ncbi:hypothetical protein Pelo_10208 [Pelomyxa schiedti]|nr:hypothetical protein Pelo_10208 [Pelomyxa schiedti]
MANQPALGVARLAFTTLVLPEAATLDHIAAQIGSLRLPGPHTHTPARSNALGAAANGVGIATHDAGNRGPQCYALECRTTMQLAADVAAAALVSLTGALKRECQAMCAPGAAASLAELAALEAAQARAAGCVAGLRRKFIDFSALFVPMTAADAVDSNFVTFYTARASHPNTAPACAIIHGTIELFDKTLAHLSSPMPELVWFKNIERRPVPSRVDSATSTNSHSSVATPIPSATAATATANTKLHSISTTNTIATSSANLVKVASGHPIQTPAQQPNVWPTIAKLTGVANQLETLGVLQYTLNIAQTGEKYLATSGRLKKTDRLATHSAALDATLENVSALQNKLDTFQKSIRESKSVDTSLLSQRKSTVVELDQALSAAFDLLSKSRNCDDGSPLSSDAVGHSLLQGQETLVGLTKPLTQLHQEVETQIQRTHELLEKEIRVLNSIAERALAVKTDAMHRMHEFELDAQREINANKQIEDKLNIFKGLVNHFHQVEKSTEANLERLTQVRNRRVEAEDQLDDVEAELKKMRRRKVLPSEENTLVDTKEKLELCVTLLGAEENALLAELSKPEYLSQFPEIHWYVEDTATVPGPQPSAPRNHHPENSASSSANKAECPLCLAKPTPPQLPTQKLNAPFAEAT